MDYHIVFRWKDEIHHLYTDNVRDAARIISIMSIMAFHLAFSDKLHDIQIFRKNVEIKIDDILSQ